jgi:hypothetical protein
MSVVDGYGKCDFESYTSITAMSAQQQWRLKKESRKARPAVVARQKIIFGAHWTFERGSTP